MTSLVLSWEGKFYWDKVLVMGHRSAPYIMQRITNAITYIHENEGHWLKNYMDDFVGADEPVRAQESFQLLGIELEEIGVVEAPEKAVEPAPVVEFLGVLFNAPEGTMEVTDEKLKDVMDICDEWMGKSYCTRTELEHLVGKLQFIASCVRPGRIFVSRILNQLRGMPREGSFPVSHQLKKDVFWWKTFLPEYNGVSIMWLQQFDTPDSILATDASGTGLGGTCLHEYFHLKIPPQYIGYNIAYLEVLAVIVAIKLWGDKLFGSKVVVNCDNLAVVQVLNNGRSRDLFLQAAMREVAFLAARFEFPDTLSAHYGNPQ